MNFLGSELRAMALSGHLGHTSEIKSRVVRVNWFVGSILGVLVGSSGLFPVLNNSVKSGRKGIRRHVRELGDSVEVFEQESMLF